MAVLGLNEQALLQLLEKEPDQVIKKAITFLLGTDENEAYRCMKKLEAHLLSAGKALPEWLRIALYNTVEGKRRMEALEDYFAEARNDRNC